MRKVIALAALVLVLSLSACCSVEKQGVENLGKMQDIINAEYLQYVAADPKLDAKSKDDRVKLVKSENDLRAGLLKR